MLAESGLTFPFCVHMYHFAYGNSLGTITYLWKIPSDSPIDEGAISRVFAELTSQQSKYSTRAMRRDFLHKYERLAKISKFILRNAYRTLVNDASAASCAAEAQLDECVVAAMIYVSIMVK